MSLTFLLAPKHGVRAQVRELEVEDTEKLDVVLLLDASGSMRITDPQRLREQGAKLFLQFLREKDHLGIIEFAEKPSTIRSLSQFSPAKLLSNEQEIERVGDEGTYTHLYAAVEAGREMLNTQGRPDAKKLLVLLSDGKMDPPASFGTSEEASKKLLQVLLPDLKVEGVRIHTLAFSDKADRDLLSQIALQTGGVNWFSPSVDKLHSSFADLFLVAKRPQVVPLKKKGFAIDDAVDEATFYIDHEEETRLRVINPFGDRYTLDDHPNSIKWFGGKSFDVVTIESPDVGLWTIEGVKDKGGFATVLTKLKLRADWPNTVSVGDKTILRAQLYEGSKPIILPEMTDVVKYGYQIIPTDRVAPPLTTSFLYDDGTHGDAAAHDGIFSTAISVLEPGEYRLRVLAQSPTFEREQNRPFRVRPQWIKVQIVGKKDHHSGGGSTHNDHNDHNDHGGGAHHETTGDVFEVILSPDTQGFRETKVELLVKDTHGGRKMKLPLDHDHHDSLRYTAASSLIGSVGEYEVSANLTLKPTRGPRKSYTSNTLYYEFHPEGEKEEVVVVEEVVVTKKKKKEEEPQEEEGGFPLASVLLVTLLNGIVGALGFFFVMKLAREDDGADPLDLAPPEDAVSALSALEEKRESSEIDLKDPKFKTLLGEGEEEPASGKSKETAAPPEEPQEDASSETEEEERPSEEAPDGEQEEAADADEEEKQE